MSDESVRLHGLLVANRSRSLLIRRCGDESTTFRWNLNDDSFSAGHQLAGRIYTRRSDLSPGGGYLMFFATDSEQRWTGISRAPFLNAQGHWLKESPAYGGGMFTGPRLFWLNDGDGHGEFGGELAGLERQDERPGDDHGSGCAGVYVLRLQRDGWKLAEVRKNDEDVVTAHVFEKSIDERWTLRKLAWTPPPWDDVTKETHELVETATGAVQALEGWDWAELDRERVVWSSGGLLKCGQLGSQGITAEKTLVDLAE